MKFPRELLISNQSLLMGRESLCPVVAKRFACHFLEGGCFRVCRAEFCLRKTAAYVKKKTIVFSVASWIDLNVSICEAFRRKNPSL